MTDEEVDACAGAQIHGGPDAQSRITGTGWGLGANRLAIIAPDGGRQPYSLPGIHVVFNGEIYNHRALRRMLVARGYGITDACDGSILPALYHEYGESFVDHLDGMYAIAVLDLRRGPKLVIANDHAGMKSLYYRWSPETRELHFSSELSGLFCFNAVPRVPTPDGLESYLALKVPLGATTMFEGVQVLEPGTTLVVQDGVIRLHRRSPWKSSVVDGTDGAPGDLDQLLRHEVRSLLDADVPVSVVTSGGLDSSLVTAYFAGHRPHPATFNIAYRGDWPGDERTYAREVAQAFSSIHHQVIADPDEFPELLWKVVEHLGQPNAAPITLSTYVLFQAVRDAGFKVVLTGDGADELFGGYAHAISAVRHAGADWWERYRDSLVSVPRDMRLGLYQSDYREHVVRSPNVESVYLDQPADHGDRLAAITEWEMSWKFPAYHLRRVDHLSMAHGVEARLPFCQRSVMAFAHALTSDEKIQGSRGKLPLRNIAERSLPASVVQRRKQPFLLPIGSMLTAGSALTEFAYAVLSDPAVAADGQIDPTRATALIDLHLVRPGRLTAQAIWSLLVYQIWRELYGRRRCQRPTRTRSAA